MTIEIIVNITATMAAIAAIIATRYAFKAIRLCKDWEASLGARSGITLG